MNILTEPYPLGITLGYAETNEFWNLSGAGNSQLLTYENHYGIAHTSTSGQPLKIKNPTNENWIVLVEGTTWVTIPIGDSGESTTAALDCLFFMNVFKVNGGSWLDAGYVNDLDCNSYKIRPVLVRGIAAIPAGTEVQFSTEILIPSAYSWYDKTVRIGDDCYSSATIQVKLLEKR